MNRDEILIDVYSDTFYKGYAASYKPSLVDEIISELIISLTSMDEAKLISIHKNKELKYYCIAIIRNMVINEKSNFNAGYSRHAKYEQEITYDNNSFKCDEANENPLFAPALDNVVDDIVINVSELEDELISDIYKFLKKRGENVCGEWYNEELFKQCFKDGKNHREISGATKIPFTSVYRSIEDTKTLIQTKFKDRYNDIRTN